MTGLRDRKTVKIYPGQDSPEQQPLKDSQYVQGSHGRTAMIGKRLLEFFFFSE
jgi:hypothetical protein